MSPNQLTGLLALFQPPKADQAPRQRSSERFLTIWSRPVARLEDDAPKAKRKRKEWIPQRRILPYV